MTKTPALLGFSVEAPGIENDQRLMADTIEHLKGSIGVRALSANVPDRAPKCAIERGEVAESSGPYELSNVVETALAKALILAAEAKRWDVVMQITDELRSREKVELCRSPGGKATSNS